NVGTTSRAARMLKAGQIRTSIGKAATGLAVMATGAALVPRPMVAGSQVGSALASAPGAVAGRSVAAVSEGAVALGKHIGSSIKKGADTYSNLNGESYPHPSLYSNQYVFLRLQPLRRLQQHFYQPLHQEHYLMHFQLASLLPS
ncbi:hypothetical protein ACIKK6_03925, partial [Bacillus thuringiensis]|uniref:hypothetical protein n=1 Tax=Bacillus thuringiensis TaxID=1428 RepID=UPI0037CF628C